MIGRGLGPGAIAQRLHLSVKTGPPTACYLDILSAIGPIVLQVDPCSLIVCDDGLYCNGQETCDSSSGVAVCKSGDPPKCDDSVSCTDDACDKVNDTCTNTPNDGNCDDGLYCNGTETCSPTNDCQAGTPIDCGDGYSCTDDVCDEATDSCKSTDNGSCAKLPPAGSGCTCTCTAS